MIYKVELIPTATLEGRMNELGAEGWTLVSCHAHPFDTDAGRPVFVTVWSK